jgi:hypothetical protein
LQDFVSDRRTAAAGSIGALMVAWTLFTSPPSAFSGLPIAGLAILMMTTTVMCLGRLSAVPSLARVIHDGDPGKTLRRQRARGSRRSISASAAD